jgi:hypothetical protein
MVPMARKESDSLALTMDCANGDDSKEWIAFVAIEIQRDECSQRMFVAKGVASFS